VHAGDSPATLEKRVLEREHPLLVATVAAIAPGHVALEGDSVLYRGQPLASPLQLDAQGALRLDDHPRHP
jgi:phosphoribosylglycinamide formyltransferase-1